MYRGVKRLVRSGVIPRQLSVTVDCEVLVWSLTFPLGPDEVYVLLLIVLL